MWPAARALKNLATKMYSLRIRTNSFTPDDVEEKYYNLSESLLMPATRIEERLKSFFHPSHFGTPQLLEESFDVFVPHVEEIEALVKVTKETQIGAARSEDNIFALLRYNAVKAKYDNLRNLLEDIVERMEAIVTRGLDGRLHPFALKKSKLKQILLQIQSDPKHRATSPLYSPDNAHLYYSTPKITKVQLESHMLKVVVRIPLVNFREKSDIVPLTTRQKDASFFDISSFDYVAKNNLLEYHHLLKREELEWCIKVRKLGQLDYVCPNNKAKIFGQIGDIVISDLTPVEYVVMSKENIKGSLECGSGEQNVLVESSSVIKVQTRCSLSSVSFSIPKRGKSFVTEPDENFYTNKDQQAAKEFEKPTNQIPELIREIKRLKEELESKKEAEEKSNETMKHIMASTDYGTVPFLMLAFGILSCCFCRARLFNRKLPRGSKFRNAQVKWSRRSKFRALAQAPNMASEEQIARGSGGQEDVVEMRTRAPPNIRNIATARANIDFFNNNFNCRYRLVDGWTPVNGQFYCIDCKKSLNYKRKDNLATHTNSRKHQRQVEARTSLEEMIEDPNDDSDIRQELVECFLAVNIPLYKLRHPVLIAWLVKWTTFVPPSETQARRLVNVAYQKAISGIKSILEGSRRIWVSVDGMTDPLGRPVVNVILGVLNATKEDPFLSNSMFLTGPENAQLTEQAIQETLDLYGIPDNKFKLLTSDGAAYMKLCGKNLKEHRYPDLVHVTCACHALSRVCDLIMRVFARATKLIVTMKQVFTKAPHRRADFQRILPGVELPPSPIITRWGEQIDATSYFDKNWEGLREVVKDFNSDEATSIEWAKELLDDEPTRQEIRFVARTFTFLSRSIKMLEGRGMTLFDQLQIWEEAKLKIHNISNTVDDYVIAEDIIDLIIKKFDDVETKNQGLADLKEICRQMQNYEGPTDRLPFLSSDYVQAFKFAPITSVECERSFSWHRLIFSDRRYSFTPTNLMKTVITNAWFGRRRNASSLPQGGADDGGDDGGDGDGPYTFGEDDSQDGNLSTPITGQASPQESSPTTQPVPQAQQSSVLGLRPGTDNELVTLTLEVITTVLMNHGGKALGSELLNKVMTSLGQQINSHLRRTTAHIDAKTFVNCCLDEGQKKGLLRPCAGPLGVYWQVVNAQSDTHDHPVASPASDGFISSPDGGNSTAPTAGSSSQLIQPPSLPGDLRPVDNDLVKFVLAVLFSILRDFGGDASQKDIVSQMLIHFGEKITQHLRDTNGHLSPKQFLDKCFEEGVRKRFWIRLNEPYGTYYSIIPEYTVIPDGQGGSHAFSPSSGHSNQTSPSSNGSPFHGYTTSPSFHGFWSPSSQSSAPSHGSSNSSPLFTPDYSFLPGAQASSPQAMPTSPSSVSSNEQPGGSGSGEGNQAGQVLRPNVDQEQFVDVIRCVTMIIS